MRGRGSVAARDLRDRVPPAWAHPPARHQEHARPVPGADDDVLRPRRAVKVVPLFHRPLLVVDDDDALAGQDEKALLRAFAVVAAVRLPGLEHVEAEAHVREAHAGALEVAEPAHAARVQPARLAAVDDEPTVVGRDEPALESLHPCFGHCASLVWFRAWCGIVLPSELTSLFVQSRLLVACRPPPRSAG